MPDAAHLIDVRSAVPEEASAIAALGTGPIANKHAFIVESFSWRTVWGAYIEERIVGYAVWDRRFFGRPFLWLLGVDPAFRRRGIAARLLAAYERGCIGEPLFVSTNESNHPMHELLNRSGYQRSGGVDNLDPGDPEVFYFKSSTRC